MGDGRQVAPTPSGGLAYSGSPTTSAEDETRLGRLRVTIQLRIKLGRIPHPFYVSRRRTNVRLKSKQRGTHIFAVRFCSGVLNLGADWFIRSNSLIANEKNTTRMIRGGL